MTDLEVVLEEFKTKIVEVEEEIENADYPAEDIDFDAGNEAKITEEITDELTEELTEEL